MKEITAGGNITRLEQHSFLSIWVRQTVGNDCVVFLLSGLSNMSNLTTELASVATAVDLTGTVYGYLAILLFALAYILVPLENVIHLRKSKPVLLAAGLIWILVALAYLGAGDTHTAHEAIRSSLLEYAELFLFLLAAMTYINAMEERNVFQALRAFLVSRGFSLRIIFWLTGLLAFLISPIADNLTTALLMGAVVMAVGGDNKKFVGLACINVVIAANAGGAFSPFGDITTLMVWQKGKVHFAEFWVIFFPSLVNWLIPAAAMSMAIANTGPKMLDEKVSMKYGARAIMAFFLLTITTAVCFHNFLHLPPVVGMMLGLGFLGPLSYHIKLHEGRSERYDYILGTRGAESINPITTILKSKLELSDIIEKVPMPAFAIDNDHNITHWNKACEEFTGLPAPEMVGTRNQWQPFYDEKQPVMADLVLNYMPEKAIERHYAGHFKRSTYFDGVYEATRFVPSLGENGRWICFTGAPLKNAEGEVVGAVEVIEDYTDKAAAARQFDLMKKISRAEWDTLLFFYGVIMCVGGLAQFGYLAVISQYMYHDLGATTANVLVGLLSAVVDNIPVMYAVLTMDPSMSHGQWLLVTLTAGVGGSMLSIGSAAGVALMGTARGVYTFGTHLRWTPAILIGYAAGILCHLFLNARLM
ncbi:MAG: sodium:proton antiporter NhaD [Desulfofustis sp.]|nr:sodium:proton antiporter NhaD [Desulfofustis sp.]